MGYYINPANETKEEWLEKNARVIKPSELNNFDFTSSELPVCLVDNRAFTAAGIAVDKHELEVFNHPDGRTKLWYVASKDKLAEWL